MTSTNSGEVSEAFLSVSGGRGLGKCHLIVCLEHIHYMVSASDYYQSRQENYTELTQHCDPG